VTETLRATADTPWTDGAAHTSAGAGGVLLSGAVSSQGMCRNITPLRGLQPPATAEEVESAARQYVRKVAAINTAGPMATPAVERIAAATHELLADLPPRRQPPAVLPPLRRR
jgi:hypothetical protein